MASDTARPPVGGIYIRSVTAAWVLALSFLVAGAVLGAVLDHRVYVEGPETLHRSAHRPPAPEDDGDLPRDPLREATEWPAG
jgi:hypothetical protein